MNPIIFGHLEKIGWVISDRFYNLNRNIGFITKAPHFQEDNQRKWYWLNYQQIFEDTGFDLSINANPVPNPPKRRKRPLRANLQKCRKQSAQDFDPDKAAATLVSFFESGRPVQTQEPKQYRIRIEELDEEVHEILWKHQERLEALNVDLEAAKIHQAIIDNPYHLEDAIYAFYEASAKGTLESKQATGYLYNALRQGWKPRELCGVAPPVETNPQRHFGHPDWHPPTLHEIIERKNVLWKIAALRPSVEEWARQTPGVILTEDGLRLSC